MSDWIDLQLAHSLVPVEAPVGLWHRIDAAVSPAAPAPPRRFAALRWSMPCAVAAVLLFLLIRASTLELRSHPEFASNDPIAVEQWLAHRAGIPVPLRPASGVRITGARVERPGVATVTYVADGRPATITVTRGALAAPGAAPGRALILAANNSRFDASCRQCHSL